MDFKKPFLLISDLQIPFEAKNALQFCSYVKKHYKIPDENVLNCGDETDQCNASMYPKDPEAEHTHNSEIQTTREKLKEWYAVFPKMKIAESNHMMRWIKKAANADIPEQLLRPYRELYHMPDGWIHQKEWVIETKHRFKIKHGVDLSGKTPYRKCVELSNISTAFGHLHSSAGICFLKTEEKSIWSMNTGCLIDINKYAFKYERNNIFKPNLTIGLVFNEGSMPVLLPYE